MIENAGVGIKILFDMDGTLIDYIDKPRHEMINLLRTLQTALPQAEIIIASGGGVSYARTMADRIGLSDVSVKDKHALRGWADIVFDDYEATGLLRYGGVWIPV